ncbi:unnamed protein product [marine sediment metagenome]|uniref:Uncharacterized protein n=1 Tax=marine sediment metagenome TaxID=412755 RepID=X0T009_9ZZZZ
MTKFLENRKSVSGYYSIVHDVELGDHLEVSVTDNPTAETRDLSRMNTLCGYVAGVHVKSAEPNGVVIDLSPANPLALLRTDCPKERTDAIFPVVVASITHYRKIDPAP